MNSEEYPSVPASEAARNSSHHALELLQPWLASQVHDRLDMDLDRVMHGDHPGDRAYAAVTDLGADAILVGIPGCDWPDALPIDDLPEEFGVKGCIAARVYEHALRSIVASFRKTG